MNDDLGALHIRLMDTAFDAAQALDPAGMVAFYADDAVFEFPAAPDGFPSRLDGKPAIAAFFAQFPKFYTSIRFLDRVYSTFADGSGLLAEYRGEWVNIKGRPYNNTYAAVVRFREGQVVSVREFFDPAVWLASLQPASR